MFCEINFPSSQSDLNVYYFFVVFSLVDYLTRFPQRDNLSLSLLPNIMFLASFCAYFFFSDLVNSFVLYNIVFSQHGWF